MFKSLKYRRFDPKTNQFLYKLEDSEFGIVEVGVGVEVWVGLGVAVGIAIAREYSKRGLDVGKNLAVAVMWYYETYRYTIENTCKNQDKYCPEYVPGWKKYATSRDEHLEKILLLR